jgi:hypothetical protein
MKLPRNLLTAVAGVALVAAACGDDDDSTATGDSSSDRRTVDAGMKITVEVA